MIEKAFRPLHGEIELLGDKSIAHRALILATLAKGKSIIQNFPNSGVIQSMINSLKNLGVKIYFDQKNNIVEIIGHEFKSFEVKDASCFCDNSATTMRLLIGMIAGTKSIAILDGNQSLRERPIRVHEILNLLGYSIKTDNGHLPCSIDIPTGSMDIPIEVDTRYKSAQVKSAIILAALGRNSQTRIIEQFKTRDHTEKMLFDMGADIAYDQNGVIVVQPLKKDLFPLIGKLPGDISSAAFILVSAAIVPNSKITIKHVLLNDFRIGFFEALEQAGCTLDVQIDDMIFGEKVGNITIESPNELKPITIESENQVGNMIDEFPALSMLMICANGKSVVRNAKELRYKESDRIKSIIDGFNSLGLENEEMDDGFSVIGNINFIQKHTIKTNKDHRIAIAFSILNLLNKCDIDDTDIISQSFPNFENIIQKIK